MDDLEPVPHGGFLASSSAPLFSIYVRTGANAKPVLYRRHDLPLSEKAVATLLQSENIEVFIPRSEMAAFRAYIEQNLEAIVAAPGVSVQQKSYYVYQAATGLMEHVLAEPRSQGILRRCRQLVRTTIDFVASGRQPFRHLLNVISFDYYTYTHSVNVFVFATALAQFVGYRDPNLLRAFGEGALLHDMGKSLLDPEIIRSRSKLTPEQWSEMRRHPVYGWELMREHGCVDELTLAVVRHHHEKLDGTGYPDGLTGARIPPLVRIATLADIFDALTTVRSYKDAMSTFDAMRLMSDGMRAELDRPLLRSFMTLMSESAA